MNLTNYNGKAVCFDCREKFEKGFELDFDRRFFNNIKICSKCAKKIYNDLGKKFVPKSPKNVNSKINVINEI